MFVDKGMYVRNYVGTYDMINVPGYQSPLIMSREFLMPEEGEEVLPIKKIFDYDNNRNSMVFLKMANVDVNSDESILAFCNEYGLPNSEARFFEKEANIDEDTDPYYRQVTSETTPYIFPRKDYMERTMFCISVVRIKYMVAVKAFLDNKITEENAGELLQCLIYLLFYSRTEFYEYDENDPAPTSRCLRLQYYYQLLRKFRLTHNAFHSEEESLRSFLDFCHDTFAAGHPAIYIPRTWKAFDDPMNKSLRIDIAPAVYSKEGKIVLGFFWKLFHDAGMNIDFSINNYCELKFSEKLCYHGDLEELRQVTKIVFTDVINAYISNVEPRLSINEGGEIVGDWKLDFQESGMFMELFVTTAINAQIRLCKNPTCKNYFSVSEGRIDRIYCCTGCALLQAKRKQRERDRLKKQSEKQKTE